MTAGIETDLKLQDYLPYRLSVLSNAVSRGVAERYQRDFNISVCKIELYVKSCMF